MNHTISITDAQIRSFIAAATVDLNSAEAHLLFSPDDAATHLRLAAGYLNTAAVLLTCAMEGK